MHSTMVGSNERLGKVSVLTIQLGSNGCCCTKLGTLFAGRSKSPQDSRFLLQSLQSIPYQRHTLFGPDRRRTGRSIHLGNWSIHFATSLPPLLRGYHLGKALVRRYPFHSRSQLGMRRCCIKQGQLCCKRILQDKRGSR